MSESAAAAIVSLVLLAASVVLAVVVGVQRFLRGLSVLGCLVVACSHVFRLTEAMRAPRSNRRSPRYPRQHKCRAGPGTRLRPAVRQKQNRLDDLDHAFTRPAFTKKEEPVLAGLELTPTSRLDEARHYDEADPELLLFRGCGSRDGPQRESPQPAGRFVRCLQPEAVERRLRSRCQRLPLWTRRRRPASVVALGLRRCCNSSAPEAWIGLCPVPAFLAEQ